MYVDGVICFQSSIRVSTLLQLPLSERSSSISEQVKQAEKTCRVVEVARGNSFLYRCDIIAVRIGLNNNLNPLAQPCKLVPDISGTAYTLELKELLVAELLRVVCFGPLFPYVEQREVISARFHKVLPGLVRVKLLVLGSIEQRPRFRKHGNDREDLTNRSVRQSSVGK